MPWLPLVLRVVIRPYLLVKPVCDATAGPHLCPSLHCGCALVLTYSSSATPGRRTRVRGKSCSPTIRPQKLLQQEFCIALRASWAANFPITSASLQFGLIWMGPLHPAHVLRSERSFSVQLHTNLIGVIFPYLHNQLRELWRSLQTLDLVPRRTLLLAGRDSAGRVRS